MSRSTLGAYTFDELAAICDERPELGRVEIIHGSLVAEGAEMTGDRHQGTVGALFELLIAVRPPEYVIRLDTYWFVGDSRLRPDIAVWRQDQRPSNGGEFKVPPLASIEIVSRDDGHDMVRKHAIYRDHGVATWYVDCSRRHGWWITDGEGNDVTAESLELTIPGWPSATVTDAIITV